MKQSMLTKTKRSIKSILMSLQLLALLFAMTLGISSHAQTVTYIHTDGLGSPVAKSDANGNLIAGSRTRYEPYGMTVAGTATPTIGFTGHVNDADTGLTYMQQRYYDPVAGRFLSTDPVLTDYNSGASFNRYVYAENNPYRYVDPDGRAVKVAVGVGLGILLFNPISIDAAKNALRTFVEQVKNALKSEPANTKPPEGKKDTLQPGSSKTQSTTAESSESENSNDIESRRSPTFPCTNCGGPTGGATGDYCSWCNIKSEDPNGQVPPNPSRPKPDTEPAKPQKPQPEVIKPEKTKTET